MVAKKAEDEGAGKRDDLAIVFDAMPFLVIYKDTKNRILRANKAVAESLGVAPEDMENTPSARWYPDEAAAYYADDLDVIRSNLPKLQIVEQVDVGGEKRWFQTDKYPTHDSDGAVTGVVLIGQDITARRQLERQVRHAQRMESVGRLAGGIAHDFNNLLTAVLVLVSVVERDVREGNDIGGSMQQIRQACHRAARLTQQLLAFARKQVSRREPTNLNSLLANWAATLARVLPDNVIVRTELGARSVALVDPGQIEQVVLNLVLNARDAMPGGGTLTIRTEDANAPRVWRAAESDDLPRIKLVVRDDGCGMPVDVAERVFEPFFTTKEGGSGLGLAMCFGIVEQHGGSIGIETGDGVGTSVGIYLPVADEAPRADGAGADLAVVDVCGTERILVVEDEPIVREMTNVALSSAGYAVTAVGDGAQALALDCGEFDLLVTDIVMPGVGGLELAELLLESGVVRNVLLMTAYSADMVERRPGRDWPLIGKPFSSEQLCARVRQVLDASEPP